jgi:NADH oxidase (H2O2-forming)
MYKQKPFRACIDPAGMSGAEDNFSGIKILKKLLKYIIIYLILNFIIVGVLMKIVICGFGSAGYSAAMTVKRIDPKTEITIIDPKETDLVHPCGLPYALEGIVKNEDLVQNLNLSRSGIIKIRGKAVKISPDEKTVAVTTGSGTTAENYDKLIIATGCTPFIPPVTNLDRYMNLSVFTLAGLRDLSFIEERMKNAMKCVIIGGGAIGIETAYALKMQNREVTILEMENQLLKGILDPDMSMLFEKYLESAGIRIIKGNRVSGVDGKECLRSIICSDVTIPADMAVISTGFRPDTSLAMNSGIEYTPAGIKTDEMLMTSRKDVYAAGDCIINYSSVDGKPVVSRLATSAYKQGAAAAVNAMGGGEKYRGSAGTFVTKTGSFEIAGTGFNTDIAGERGFEPVAGKITSKIKPDYYPDNSDITVKIILDKYSGIILGAQCAGERGAAERVNIISMAIEFGITIDELSRLEMAYAPPVSEVYDPLLRAADFGLRRMKNR